MQNFLGPVSLIVLQAKSGVFERQSRIVRVVAIRLRHQFEGPGPLSAPLAGGLTRPPRARLPAGRLAAGRLAAADRDAALLEPLARKAAFGPDETFLTSL